MLLWKNCYGNTTSEKTGSNGFKEQLSPKPPICVYDINMLLTSKMKRANTNTNYATFGTQLYLYSYKIGNHTHTLES